MIAQAEIEIGIHLITNTLLNIIIINIAPHNRSFAHSNYVDEASILVPIRAWQAKRDVCVRYKG